MAAIYSYDTQGADLFKSGVQVLSSVQVDFLSDFYNGRNLTVITDISVQNSETSQFFLTFDDVVKWFYFGKGMGSMSIRGMFLSCNGVTPGLMVFFNNVMLKARGQAVRVSIGNAIFECVLTNSVVQLTQDPAPVVEFTLSLNIVNHNLPGRRPQNVPCTAPTPGVSQANANASPALTDGI